MGWDLFLFATAEASLPPIVEIYKIYRFDAKINSIQLAISMGRSQSSVTPVAGSAGVDGIIAPYSAIYASITCRKNQ